MLQGIKRLMQARHYLYSAKAFDVLERLDPSPEYWDGKKGACVGVFKQLLAHEESPESFKEVLAMLKNSVHPQVDRIVRVMKQVNQYNAVCQAEIVQSSIKNGPEGQLNLSRYSA
jgi:hypothetical protein